MDFRILGPLEALDGGERIALGGTKRRALLALLLLHANETVSSERLIDDLWGEEPPSTAAKTLQVHVSRLRKTLSDGRAPDDSALVVTRGHGYALEVDLENLDAHRFERLLEQGRAELAAGRAADALATLERALALWRGPALADLSYEPFAQPEIARLEDLRVAACEQLVEAKLALGRQSEVIAQLESLIDEHPYREGLRAQLMLALYRADRQADALQAYQEARNRLVEELGIEPGERLRELERAILAQEPALLLTPAPVAPEAGEAEAPEEALPATAPVELPSGVVTFLLTDIEASSALWEAAPAGMAAALELHDELIEETVGLHSGRLLKSKGEGDSTLSVFRRASDAVAAAAELQTRLAEAAWPEGLAPRVRIAVHSGEVHERAGDYFGAALNRAARLRALADGGAVLVSHATAEIVQDRLPDGAELADLGEHRLRGLSRPEQVFELRSGAVARARSLAAARETRKTVSVVFACVLDPAAGEPADAEAGRRLSTRALAAMRAALERHGGTVREYPGDALMAMFGVPQLHEDDALRAVRAGVEIVRDLDPAVRVGVSTGEVIAAAAAPDEPLAAGPAVNVAKRLEEAAGGGELLVDEATERLVRGYVDAGAAAGTAVRVLGMRPAGGRPRGLSSPLVGRGPQLEALSRTFAAALGDRTCHLVTLLGAAGVGKSRLVEEFVARTDGAAAVVAGRCLAYGEGITFWPLAEVVHALAPLDAQLAEDPKGGLVADAVSEAVGSGRPARSTPENISWAFRRLFEAAARRRPLVVVLDDLQWAEPTLLDLIEQVAELARDAPLMLLCMARPELLDTRPGWGGGKLNATSILLEPLPAEDSRRLVTNLVSQAELPAEAAGRLADACEGNPLFAEELLSMLIEDGSLRREDSSWSLAPHLAGELPVPPTIHALLAARLERLPGEERTLLARVSVAGTSFDREAFRELAPDALRSSVDRILTALLRRDMIRPDRPALLEDDAFRFRHMLIRDAAYRSLPKEARAELHERFAGWLERVAGARVGEVEEILGYHLEQAHRFLAELGAPDGDAERLAARASQHLERAGRRALARSDVAAAAALLDRAAALVLGDDARRAALLGDLGAALIEAGRLAEAADALDDASRTASAVRDERAAARALVQRQFLRLQRGESGGTGEAGAVVEQVLPVFARAGDEPGLCGALRLAAWRHWIEGRAEPAAAAWEQAAEHARSAGEEHERVEILLWIASSLFFGPAHVDHGIRRCEAIRAELDASPAATAELLQPLAGLHAMQGRFDEARQLLAASEASLEELGLTLHSAVSHHAAMVELLAGDPAAAERSLRRGYSALEEMGDQALLSTTAAFLGQAVLAQGRGEEAERLAGLSAELAARDDLVTQVLWRSVRVARLAQRDELDEAERLAREAVELAERTDFVNQKADARVQLGRVLLQRGDRKGAGAAFREALRLYELKGNAVAAGGVDAALATGPRL